MRKPQINHRHCEHAATPAARRTCREAYWAKEAMETADATGTGPLSAQAVQDSKIGKAPQDWSDEAKAATTWVDAYPVAPDPIVIHFVLKSGKTCKVIFDQYTNAELFTRAAEQGWDRTRTVNQAISEAINGASPPICRART